MCAVVTAQQTVRLDPRWRSPLSQLFSALALCSPCYRLRLLQGRLTIQRFRSHPPGWDVVPVKVLAGPPIREAHLKAPIAGDGLVLNDSDASGFHLPPGRGRRTPDQCRIAWLSVTAPYPQP